jgi:DNA-directed RNA polymerase subunit RPC12/RpoP
MIEFFCANCGWKYEKDQSLAGKKARCKECGHVFVIPRPSCVASSASSAPASSPQRRRPAAHPAYEAVDDPYGLDDVPPVLKSAAPLPVTEDEDFVVPRRVHPRQPKPKGTVRSRGNDGIPFFDGLSGTAYLLLFGVVVGATVLALNCPPSIALALTSGALLIPVALWVYADIGYIVVPFRESYLCGVMNLFIPFYGLYYLVSRWDAMRGAFFAHLAAFGMIILPIIFLPAVAQTYRSMQGGAASTGRRARGPTLEPAPAVRPRPETPPGPAPGFPGLADGPPGWPGPGNPAPGAQAPILTTSITLVVTGLNDQASGQAFGNKLGELCGKVSGGFLISSSASGGKSSYSISMVNPVAVQAFADQITWARVTSISGQTITIDAAAAGD